MFHIAAKRQDKARKRPPKIHFVCCEVIKFWWGGKLDGDKALNFKIAEPL